MSTPKVYGFQSTAGNGWEVPAGKHVRIVIAAPSRKAAVDIANQSGLSVTVGFLTTYAALTGNAAEIAVATEHPGRVLYSADGHKDPFHVAPIRVDRVSEPGCPDQNWDRKP